MSRLNGTLKTIITGIVALVLVFVLVKVVLWSLYNTNVFDFLNNDAEKLNFTYSDTSKSYSGTLENKYDVTIKDPIKFNFDGYLQISEKQSQVYTSGVVITLKIIPDFKSDFTYTILIDEINSSTSSKTSKGSIDIESSTLKLVKDETTDQSGDKILSTYNARIQKLIETAKTSFGDAIG